MKCLWSFALAVLLVFVSAGCKPGGPASPAESAITNYTVRGVVLSLKPAERQVVIRHEEVPGYMDAMTMPFEVRNADDLRGVRPGDGVEFRMRVTEKDAWIDQVRVVSNAPPAATVVISPTNAPAGFRVLPNVPDLKPGDLVPDYSFTNQLGQPFHLAQYHGQALAVTFVFTRCPYPVFCPRMSDNFSQVQQVLANRAGGPTNWQLLTVTFDPKFDTPNTMKAYGQRWKADPAHWTLATGSFDQIEPFAISVGLFFGRDVAIGDQNHNLRTLVIDPDGRLRQILVGNQWTPEELAEILATSARGKKQG